MQLNATDPASDVYCPTWGGGEGESVVQQAPNGRFPTFGGGGADTSNNASEFNMGCVLFCVSPSLFLALSRSFSLSFVRCLQVDQPADYRRADRNIHHSGPNSPEGTI